MEKHLHIRKHLLSWAEGTIDTERRKEVTHHLAICDSCRLYFSALTEVLAPEEAKGERRLVPNPYLPARVRAIAAAGGGTGRVRGGLAVRWTLRAAAFVLAVILGITIGESLSSRQSHVTDRHIISEFSESFWDSGFENRWQGITQLKEEERQ